MYATAERVAHNWAGVYEDVRVCIDNTVGAFCHRYGGHLPDQRADADTIFMRAMAAYEKEYPEEVPTTLFMEGWMKRWVWYELLDIRRRELSRASKRSHVVDGLEMVPELSRSRFCLTDFMEELSEDAALVIQLTLDTPFSLAEVAHAKGGQPRNFRSSLRDYLREMSWSVGRINEAFEEIKKALGS